MTSAPDRRITPSLAARRRKASTGIPADDRRRDLGWRGGARVGGWSPPPRAAARCGVRLGRGGRKGSPGRKCPGNRPRSGRIASDGGVAHYEAACGGIRTFRRAGGEAPAHRKRRSRPPETPRRKTGRRCPHQRTPPTAGCRGTGSCTPFRFRGIPRLLFFFVVTPARERVGRSMLSTLSRSTSCCQNRSVSICYPLSPHYQRTFQNYRQICQ